MTFSYLHTHTLNNKLIVVLCSINYTNLAITANYTGRSHEQTPLGREVSVTNRGWPLTGVLVKNTEFHGMGVKENEVLRRWP